ncbi:MAG: hypothetical protein AABW83_02855 [Nanoarchaeota archaeon]
MIKKVLRSFILLILIVLSFYFILKSISDYTGFSISEENKFENCLREKDIELYVKDFNQLKEIKTFDYLDYFKVYRCKNRLNCINKNISEYPTWIIEGRNFLGDIDIFRLSDITNCEMI